MAQVTLPYNLTAGSPENVNNLMSNLTALRDGVNTIDTAQIANDAVTAAKIATDAVDSAEIKAGAVGTSELASAVGNFGTWTSYTPTWTSDGTAPAIGNGSISGAYAKIGTAVIGEVRLEFGSTTTFGTGSWLFSLPVNQNAASWTPLGTAVFNVNNNVYANTQAVGYQSDKFSLRYDGTSVVNYNTPATFANGNFIYVQLSYRAA